MLIFKQVRECDFSGEVYGMPVDGFAVIAQGATGRWCEVMYGGPTELSRVLRADGEEVLTVDEARDRANALPNSYADF